MEILGRRIGVRAAEDVAVAERGRAVLLRRWRRNAAADLNRQSIRINGRTDSGVADVVPHARPVRVGRDCVHVIAEELCYQAVRARSARITDRAAVECRESARHAGGDVDVRVLQHTDQTSGAGCVVAERRRESVVNDVEVTSIGRKSRCRVEATVVHRGTCTYHYRTRPSATAIFGIAEQHLFTVETKATVHPGVDDLVGSAGASRRAVGDIERRRGRQVAPCAGDAILGAFVKDGVDVVTGVVHFEDRDRFGPSMTTVERLEQIMRPDARRRRERKCFRRRGGREMRNRQVHHAVAIAADGAPGPIAVRRVADGLGDLLRGPGVAAVPRHRHHQGHTSAGAFERGAADIDISKERAGRRVVGPDLLLS